MTRSHHAVTVAPALLLALLAGCGTGDDDPSGSSPPPDPGPTSATTLLPQASSPAVTLSREPEPGPEEQRRLDHQLREAAWADDVAQARRLVRRGADINAKDETQQSAYLIATSEGHLELLRLALRSGARVDDKDSWNGTGLIRAAERGHALVVGELLRAGIDRDHVNRIGYQAIHEAVWLGEDTPAYATTVRVLAAGGVRLSDVSPSTGLTPLEMARERGFGGLQGVLEAVVGAERPARPDRALLRAAEQGDADAVAVALRAGADTEARDDRDRTALRLATTRDHGPVSDLLVAMGAES